MPVRNFSRAPIREKKGGWQKSVITACYIKISLRASGMGLRELSDWSVVCWHHDSPKTGTHRRRQIISPPQHACLTNITSVLCLCLLEEAIQNLCTPWLLRHPLRIVRARREGTPRPIPARTTTSFWIMGIANRILHFLWFLFSGLPGLVFHHG